MPDNRKLRRLGLLVLCGTLSAAACSDDVSSEAVKRARISEGCIINSDCSNDLKCAWQRCHVECETSKDCDGTLRCVTGNRPSNVCQLQDETTCDYNSQCPEGLVCAVDGECRDQCVGDRDCVKGQVCAGGVCADPTELTNGSLPTKDGGPTSGQPCRYNSECPEPYICRSGFCGFECIADRDCAFGAQCVGNRCTSGGAGGSAGNGGGGSSGASGGADGGACRLNSDCPAGERCFDGRCAPECALDRDCRAGERCVSGACQFEVPTGAPPGYGNPCVLSSECTPGLVCGQSRCIYECRTNVDCAPGFCCSTKQTCVTGSACADASTGTGGTGGAGGSGGATGADAGDARSCSTDQDCQDRVLCNGAERCEGGRCQPALKPPCDDGNPCTADTCTEATGACSFVQTGPQDADGDGHYAIACGGSADDCDDTNRDVHPGHPELCDQLDNNCDSAIDEGRWTLGTPVTLTGVVPGGTYGTYDIGRLPSGDLVVVVNESDHEQRLFRLSSSLAILEGPTALLQRSYSAVVPSLAIGGNVIVVGNSDGSRPFIFWGSAVASLAEQQLSSASGRSPGIAWNGSEFLMAWADSRDGTFRTHVSTLAASGTPAPTARVITPNAAQSVSYTGYDTPIRIAVGPSTAIVGWSSEVLQTRYAILTKDFGTTLVTPTDLTPNGARMSDVAYGSGSFWLAWQVASTVRLTRIDPQSGAVIGSRTLNVSSSSSFPRIQPVPGGMMLAFFNSTRISFGWVPADDTKPVTLSDYYTSGAVFDPPELLALDAKNAVLLWADRTLLKVGALTCAP